MPEQASSPDSSVYVAGAADVAEAVHDGLSAGDGQLARRFRLEHDTPLAASPPSQEGPNDRFIIADDGMDEHAVSDICHRQLNSGDGTKLIFVYRGAAHFPSLYLRRGFRGLLTLGALRHQLLACLTIVSLNGIYADQRDIRQIFDDYCASSDSNKIAYHEIEIIERIVAGDAITRIAADLEINYRSILSYVGKIRDENHLLGGRGDLITHLRGML
jgi:hypothetical protein